MKGPALKKIHIPLVILTYKFVRDESNFVGFVPLEELLITGISETKV